MKCRRFFRLFLSLLALSSFAGCGRDSSAPGAGGEARWSAFPVTLRNDGFAALADPVAAGTDFDAAVQFWNSQYGLIVPGAAALASSGLFLNAFSSASLTDSSILVETGVATTTSWPLGATIAGTTVRSVTNGRISNAIIAMNAQNITFCHGNCWAPGDISYRRVIAHELGHLLGITEHSSDPANIMFDGNYHNGDLSTVTVDADRLRALTP